MPRGTPPKTSTHKSRRSQNPPVHQLLILLNRRLQHRPPQTRLRSPQRQRLQHHLPQTRLRSPSPAQQVLRPHKPRTLRHRPPQTPHRNVLGSQSRPEHTQAVPRVVLGGGGHPAAVRGCTRHVDSCLKVNATTPSWASSTPVLEKANRRSLVNQANYRPLPDLPHHNHRPLPCHGSA